MKPRRKMISEEKRELAVIKMKEGKKISLKAMDSEELRKMAHIADQKAKSWEFTAEGMLWRKARDSVLNELKKRK
ncbi:MAG: hypothetical protein QXO69_02975 [archaeon]